MASRFGFPGRVPESIQGGAMLALGLSVFGVTDNLTPLVADTVGVGQFHASRSLLAVAMLIVAARLTKSSVLPRLWWAVSLRTLLITASMMLYFGVLPMMPLAEAGAGLFTSPIFVLLFSMVLFGERIGPRRILAVALGSAGVVLVLKPGGGGFTVYHLLPMAAGALYALNSIVIYRYCRQETAYALTMAFFVGVGAAGALSTSLLTVFPVPSTLLNEAPFLFRGWAGVDHAFWLVILGIATAAMVAITLINRAYQIVQTSYAIVYEYSYLIAAGISGWFLWGDVPDGWSVLGTVFIVVAGAIITRAQKSSPRSVPGLRNR